MNNEYIQNLRYKLQKRVRRLNSTEFNVFHNALTIFWQFLDSHSIFRGICDDLVARVADANDSAIKICTKDEGLLADNELEQAAMAYCVIRWCVQNGDRADEQAIALCWIAHLTGDLHQPLHACSLYSATYPEGDKGGNLSIVRVQEGRAAYGLHTLWDGLMTSSERYQTSANIATELLARPAFQKAKLAGVDDPKPYNWAWESYRVAVRSVYLDGTLKMGTDKKEKEGTPILPAGYMQEAKAVAERQIVLAGYRLADQLVDLLGR